MFHGRHRLFRRSLHSRCCSPMHGAKLGSHALQRAQDSLGHACLDPSYFSSWQLRPKTLNKYGEFDSIQEVMASHVVFDVFFDSPHFLQPMPDQHKAAIQHDPPVMPRACSGWRCSLSLPRCWTVVGNRRWIRFKRRIADPSMVIYSNALDRCCVFDWYFFGVDEQDFSISTGWILFSSVQS